MSVPNEYALPPWPEWNDVEVNAENWYNSPSSPETKKNKQQAVAPVITGFHDPLGHTAMPPSLTVTTWQRMYDSKAVELVPDEALTKPLDLTTPNLHILHSKIMQHVLASIMNLLQLAVTDSLPPEQQTPGFASPQREWRPWHHVYALCKAGKSIIHKPQVNPSGKYIVRLFYLGTWRRITVDDYMPLDEFGRALLPLTESGLQLWPAILTKALLRVASMSWQTSNEVMDFSAVVCLTGWEMHEFDCSKIPAQFMWGLCHKLLMWDCDDEEEWYKGGVSQEATEKYISMSSKFTWHTQTPSITSLGKASLHERLGSVVLFGILADLQEKPNAVTGISPCLAHSVLLSEVRTFTETTTPEQQNMPLWKLFRWKTWAIERGIIKEQKLFTFKRIRVFSSMKLQVLSQDKILSTNILNVIQTLPEVMVTDSPREIGQKSNKLQVAKKVSAGKNKTKMKNGINDLKQPNSLEFKKVKGKQLITNWKENEPWIDFDTIIPYIKSLQVFYNPSSFEHRIKLPNVNTLEKPMNSAKTTKSKKSMTRSESLSLNLATKTCFLHSLNNVFYLLVDSVGCKKLFMTLGVLPQKMLDHYTDVLYGNVSVDDSGKLPEQNTYHTNVYHILGEKYNWRSFSLGNIEFGFKTIGSKSSLVQLGKGLIVLRIWIKVPNIYFIQISSQTPFIVDTRDKIQEIMSKESMSFLHYGAEISKAYNLLASTKPMSASHIEAVELFRRAYLPMHISTSSSKRAQRIIADIHAKFEATLIELLLEKSKSPEVINNTLIQWQGLFLQEYFGLSYLEQHTTVEFFKSLFNPDPTLDQLNLKLTEEVHDEIPTTNPKDTTHLRKTKIKVMAEKPHDDLVKLNEENIAVELIKKMVQGEQDLLKLYSFKHDDQYQMVFMDYKGVVRVDQQTWLPLVRFVVNPHNEIPSFCAIYFTASIPTSVIHVINNTTLDEVPKLLSDAEPFYFTSNSLGYTIFAYGDVSNIKTKEVQWKLRLSANKMEHVPHSCHWYTTGVCSPLQPPSLSAQELRNHYIPHKDKLIFKCLLSVIITQNVSFRVMMSNPFVQFTLRIKCGDEDIIKEYFGIGEKVIPVVRLPGNDTISNNFYVIEAEVLRNSWTLTEHEISTLTSIREKVLQDLRVFSDDESCTGHSLKRTSSSRRQKKLPTQKASRSELIPNAPYWSVLLVLDNDKNDSVSFHQDRRVEEKIRLLKSEWEEADPGRYKRGYNLRQQYLQKPKISSLLLSDIKDSQTNLKTMINELIVDKDKDIHILTAELMEENEIRLKEQWQVYSRLNENCVRYYKQLVDNQTKRLFLLKYHYDQQKNKFNQLLKNTYEERHAYIQQVNNILAEKVQMESNYIKEDMLKKTKKKHNSKLK